MAVKNQKSALAALAAAGGLWAWQNRDKIRGWIDSQRSQMSSGQSQYGSTGATRRIGEHYPSVDTGADAAMDTGIPESPRRYDPSI